MSKAVHQAGMRVVQGIKDQVSKLDSAIRSVKDSSSTQVRKFSSAIDSTGLKGAARSDKIKQAEESLRTVMYLSCWGPN